MSGELVFLDTNIIIYAFDNSNQGKQSTARNLVADLMTSGNGIISTQVLQEFYVVATQKMNIIPEMARSVLDSLMALEVIVITPELIKSAVDDQLRWQLSFWDALILSAAAHAGCYTLYSEDLSHDHMYGKVKVINPLM